MQFFLNDRHTAELMDLSITAADCVGELATTCRGCHLTVRAHLSAHDVTHLHEKYGERWPIGYWHENEWQTEIGLCPSCHQMVKDLGKTVSVN